MTRQHNNRGQQINIETVQGNVVVQKSTRSNAEWTLLQEVDREVESRLNQSLHNAVLINLGKRAQPEQVKRIWDAEVKIGAKPPEPLSPDISILEVFERSDIAGKLLILGDPGAGKTTTMLDLAQALVEKAKQDANFPIPVLINLSGWQEPGRSMPDWLVEELKSKYGVRKDIGKQWLQEKRLLPLLDGLDEVKPEQQEACVQAINQWLQSDSRPVSVVVCSRREEYASYQTQLYLNGAILLQALDNEQIQDYLINVNRPELWQILQQDAVLLDLMKTPLLLSITVLSYEALSLHQWHQLTSTQERLDLLLDAYIQTMLCREFQSRYYRNRKPPTAAQTRHWLTFLAQQLQRESQTEFLIERMQPTWLITGGAHFEQTIAAARQAIAHWLIVFLIIWLSFRLFFWLAGYLQDGEHIALFASFFSTGTLEIKPVEALSWSFKKMMKALRLGFVTGLTSGLLFGLIIGIINWLLDGSNALLIALNVGLGYGLILWIFFSMYAGLFLSQFDGWYIPFPWQRPNISDFLGWEGGSFFGLGGAEIKHKRNPNQGIRRSAINALLMALIFGLTFTLIAALIPDQVRGEVQLNFDLFTAIYVGLFSGLCFSGRACIQHFVLRLMLYRNRSIPWNYARFLNYCTERLLLQRVGGRYRFVHKLLQERFAELGSRVDGWMGENGKENE